jgi:hypothetical protein
LSPGRKKSLRHSEIRPDSNKRQIGELEMRAFASERQPSRGSQNRNKKEEQMPLLAPHFAPDDCQLSAHHVLRTQPCPSSCRTVKKIHPPSRAAAGSW